ncbi:tyrosine-type recombinase/integrase [Candidatus Woesebacteria bacterium]|nr:MAG: tyrosine-type recombinase/integrase [Candidatus Woesebacteria bacterium]
MTMNNDLDLTINNPHLSAQKIFDLLDVAESTRIDYKYRIGLFLDFLQGNGFTHNTFLEFKRYLIGRTDLSTSTKNKYLAAARIFLKELNRQGVLPVDITQNIKTFTQEKKHKRTGVSEIEMARLVSYLRSLDPTPQNTRVKAIMSLLALQGLRQVEIVRLDVEDLDLSNMTALIQGKGRDDKEPIDLHPESVRVLLDYIKSNRKASGALFTSISNNRNNQRLTTRAIREIVTTVLKGLDIEKSTHGFRHYFTTKLIKTYKGDLLEVAQYTRHRSLEMLQVYNDSIKKQADLPRYYNAFDGVAFSESPPEVPIIINTGS